MKKNYPLRKCIAVFLLAVSVIISGCVDNDYDLTKKINTDMTIGAGLTIPLGQIKKQLLGDLVDIEDMEQLEEDENGGYRFRVKDHISEVFELGSVPNFQFDVPEVAFNNSVPMPTLSTLPFPEVSESFSVSHPSLSSAPTGVTLPSVTIAYPTDSEYSQTDFTVSYEIPNEINKIDAVVFKDTEVSINLNVSDILSLITTSTEQFSMTLVFPEQCVLESMSQPNVTVTGNTAIIVDNAKNVSKKTYKFKLSKFVPKTTDVDAGNLKINEVIKSKFSYMIAGTTKAGSGNASVHVNIGFNPVVDEVIASTNAIPITFNDLIIPLTTDIDLPTEVTSVSEVLFAQSANIDLTIKNMGSQLPMKLGNGTVQIKFPLAFMFDPHLNLKKEADAWTLDIPASQLFDNRVLSFKGINLKGLTITNGKISLNDQLIAIKTISPVTFAATSGVSSKVLEGFSPKFSITQNQIDLTVKSIKGKFNIDLGLEPETISLGDLSIDGTEDVKFALLDVIFNLKINNPTSLPITLNMDLVPIDKNGVKQEAQKVSIPNVKLDANAITRLQISRYAEPSISTPDGDVKGIRTNLASLFIDLPEGIEVNIVPVIDHETEYTVELQNEPYNLQVDYDVMVPLALDKEFHVKYSDTIRDFQKDLKEVVDMVSAMKIDMDIENSIPLELTLKVTPIGLNADDDLSDKIAIELLDRDVHSSLVGLVIHSGMAGNTAAITKASINFREKVKGAMKELDGIRLEIVVKADQSREGSALNKEQYIQIKNIKVQIPEGVNISLNK